MLLLSCLLFLRDDARDTAPDRCLPSLAPGFHDDSLRTSAETIDCVLFLKWVPYVRQLLVIAAFMKESVGVNERKTVEAGWLGGGRGGCREITCIHSFHIGWQFFLVFEFQRTATERRESSLARRILEDATFEALMIFDDTHGLVSQLVRGGGNYVIYLVVDFGGVSSRIVVAILWPVLMYWGAFMHCGDALRCGEMMRTLWGRT